MSTYVCLSMSFCLCSSVSGLLWGLYVHVWDRVWCCFPPFLLLLTRVYHEPVAFWLAKLAVQQAPEIHVSLLSSTGIIGICFHTWLFHEFWGTELRCSSWWQGKHIEYQLSSLLRDFHANVLRGVIWCMPLTLGEIFERSLHCACNFSFKLERFFQSETRVVLIWERLCMHKKWLGCFGTACIFILRSE